MYSAPILIALLVVAMGCVTSSEAPEPKGPGNKKAKTAQNHTVILISIDGLRWDYLDHHKPKTLNRWYYQGASVHNLTPIFPTETIPNQYAMVSGLNAEQSGLISDEFYDPVHNITYKLREKNHNPKKQWYAGEPVWNVAAEHQLRVKNLSWTEGAPFTEPLSNDHERFRHISSLIALPQGQRPHLVTVFLNSVYEAGYKHGPESPEVTQALGQIDRMLHQLERQLLDLRLMDKVTLIVASSHGMTATKPHQVIQLTSLLEEPFQQRVVNRGSMAMVWPKKGSQTRVWNKVRHTTGHYKAYRRKDIPRYFHFKRNRRVPPILLLAKPGWTFVDKSKNSPPKGAHGYSNRHPDMQGLMIVMGRGIKPGYKIDTLSNLEVSALVRSLLGLPTSPVNLSQYGHKRLLLHR